MEDEVTFLFQLGVTRDAVSAPAPRLTLALLKELAVKFVHEKIPDNGLNRLSDRILLFRHDYCSPNVLQLINSASDVTDETLIEIVLTANPLLCSGEEPVPAPRPHALAVHSYKAPTFCDFCGEMLFGLVRQGLKCEGCGLNYHKRCAVKVPSNCASPAAGAPSTAGARRASGAPRSPSRSSHSASHSQPSHDDSLTAPRRVSSWGAPGIPHTFQLHTYTRPTVCRLCKKLLRGLFKQGLQCGDCHYNAHRKCLPFVPKDCGGEIRDHQGEKEDSISTSSELSESRVADDDSDDNEPAHHNHADNTLRECEDEPQRDVIPEHSASRPSSSSSSPSANIPLMRIVQSVKHTKRRDGQWLKEGWLVHFTNKDKTIKRHYWRLDSESVTLFSSEQGSKYYKEIPLNEILAVDSARQPQADVMHCFEMRTANVDYLVGVDPAWQGSGAPLPPPDSGVGAYLARSWETALRQALMPHTRSAEAGGAAGEGGGGGGAGGAGGGAGGERAPEMAQLYRIHPGEVLGSGQFGIVYGGLHRDTHRPVAIKVIDKLRFPTKQEAQLKNEVAILQNLSHPGVVNLERMFETPERIFVVMEKLKGDMLEMILSHEKGRLTERITKFLVAQILVALKHLHEKNIVHCDLKPENVLLSSHESFPQVKLCDFGFARIIGEKSFRRSVVGTPAYLGEDAGGATQQGIQPLAGHVVCGRHRVRVSVGHLPLQRGRGHPRADPERGLHVPARALEGYLTTGDRPHQQPAASEATKAPLRGQVCGPRLAADGRGLEGPASAGGARRQPLPHASQRRRAPRPPRALTGGGRGRVQSAFARLRASALAAARQRPLTLATNRRRPTPADTRRCPPTPADRNRKSPPLAATLKHCGIRDVRRKTLSAAAGGTRQLYLTIMYIYNLYDAKSI